MGASGNKRLAEPKGLLDKDHGICANEQQLQNLWVWQVYNGEKCTGVSKGTQPHVTGHLDCALTHCGDTA